MNKRPPFEHHIPVVVPYWTSKGIGIGRRYTPPRRWEFSRDDELLQAALLSPPQGLRRLRRLALSLATAIAAFAVLVAAVGVFSKELS